MKTTFTSEDLKNLIERIFNGNLRQSLASKGSISYVNENSEEMIFIDADTNEQTSKDLAEYLNVHFYNWKERLVETSDPYFERKFVNFESWVESLNGSMHESYALVEKVDEEIVASQDIDSATLIGKITFLVQTDKINNLEYYVTKLRNLYLGNPQDIQNANGDIVKAYLLLGTLVYDQEPTMTQLGETVIVSMNFKLSYLNDALTYSDTKVQISLDNEVTYYDMPITKGTYQNIFAVDAVPRNGRPDLTGVVATTCTMVKALSFYDYNKDLNKLLNEKFWGLTAYKVDDNIKPASEVNIPVFIKVITGGHTYIYKDVVEQMEKVVTDNDFNVCSISLRTWGKN